MYYHLHQLPFHIYSITIVGEKTSSFTSTNIPPSPISLLVSLSISVVQIYLASQPPSHAHSLPGLVDLAYGHIRGHELCSSLPSKGVRYLEIFVVQFSRCHKFVRFGRQSLQQHRQSRSCSRVMHHVVGSLLRMRGIWKHLWSSFYDVTPAVNLLLSQSESHNHHWVMYSGRRRGACSLLAAQVLELLMELMQLSGSSVETRV